MKLNYLFAIVLLLIITLISCNKKMLVDNKNIHNFGKTESKNCDTSHIVTISENLMISIPMCKLVVVPYFYPTTYFSTIIDGEKVIIQLWKGYYAGVFSFPAGIGAEVGLYRPVLWTNKIWMPDYKNKKNMSFKLILKSTNEVIVSTSKKTWWLNAWEQNCYKLPMRGDAYKLEFSVEDSTWVW